MTLCGDWITEADLLACGCPTSEATPGTVSAKIAEATEVVYALTGAQWPGVCAETIWPNPCGGGIWCGPSAPGGMLGWIDFGTPWPGVSTRCLATNGCDCCQVPVVRFDRDRIIEVTEVSIGGDILDPSAYRLDIDNRSYALTRIDGGFWPCWNDIAQSLPGPGAWSVSYDYGASPPAHVAGAAARLATEFIKACIGDESCRLPTNAIAVQTEGVSFELPNAPSFISEGRTGLWEVDLAIASVNPGGVRRRGRIISPESVDPRRIVPVAGSS